MKPSQVRLHNATGDDMGVTGSISMRGWCGDQPVVLTALVATHPTRSLCSAPKLLCARYGFELKPTRSTLYRERGKRVLLQRSGKRYFLVIRVAETSETNSVDVLTSKCEVESLKGEVLFLRAVHKSTPERRLPWTAGEKVHREIDDHVKCNNRCES